LYFLQKFIKIKIMKAKIFTQVNLWECYSYPGNYPYQSTQIVQAINFNQALIKHMKLKFKVREYKILNQKIYTDHAVYETIVSRKIASLKYKVKIQKVY
jgi:hypothetical protein